MIPTRALNGGKIVIKTTQFDVKLEILVFGEEGDPNKLNAWLEGLEVYPSTKRCSDAEEVHLAQLRLGGHAFMWWEEGGDIGVGRWLHHVSRLSSTYGADSLLVISDIGLFVSVPVSRPLSTYRIGKVALVVGPHSSLSVTGARNGGRWRYPSAEIRASGIGLQQQAKAREPVKGIGPGARGEGVILPGSTEWGRVSSHWG